MALSFFLHFRSLGCFLWVLFSGFLSSQRFVFCFHDHHHEFAFLFFTLISFRSLFLAFLLSRFVLFLISCFFDFQAVSCDAPLEFALFPSSSFHMGVPERLACVLYYQSPCWAIVKLLPLSLHQANTRSPGRGLVFA